MEPTTTDPALAELLSFFDFAHLPPRLAEASRPFHEVAHALAADPESAAVTDAIVALADAHGWQSAYRDGPGEREAGWAQSKLTEARSHLNPTKTQHERLRLLLEAKDCAVRAALVRHRAEQAAARERHALIRASEQDLGTVEMVAGDTWQPSPLLDLLARLGREPATPALAEAFEREVGNIFNRRTGDLAKSIDEQLDAHWKAIMERFGSIDPASRPTVVETGPGERLADFVVGIDVEQGPGLAALRGFVVELGAVADRLEAAMPAGATAKGIGDLIVKQWETVMERWGQGLETSPEPTDIAAATDQAVADARLVGQGVAVVTRAPDGGLRWRRVDPASVHFVAEPVDAAGSIEPLAQAVAVVREGMTAAGLLDSPFDAPEPAWTPAGVAEGVRRAATWLRDHAKDHVAEEGYISDGDGGHWVEVHDIEALAKALEHEADVDGVAPRRPET